MQHYVGFCDLDKPLPAHQIAFEHDQVDRAEASWIEVCFLQRLGIDDIQRKEFARVALRIATSAGAGEQTSKHIKEAGSQPVVGSRSATQTIAGSCPATHADNNTIGQFKVPQGARELTPKVTNPLSKFEIAEPPPEDPSLKFGRAQVYFKEEHMKSKNWRAVGASPRPMKLEFGHPIPRWPAPIHDPPRPDAPPVGAIILNPVRRVDPSSLFGPNHGKLQAEREQQRIDHLW